MADCPKKAQPSNSPARIVGGARHKDAYKSSMGDTPKSKYTKTSRLQISKIISELLSNGIKKGIESRNILFALNESEFQLDIFNNGIPFEDINDMINCLIVRNYKSQNEYDINDISMFNEGHKSILDRCQRAWLFSLKGNILSCIEVVPEIWYKTDIYPTDIYNTDHESIIKYEFDITKDKELNIHEKCMYSKFKEITKEKKMNVAFRYKFIKEKVEIEQDNDIINYLSYKWRNIKTKLEIWRPLMKSFQIIEHTSIHTCYKNHTPINLFYNNKSLNEDGISTEFIINYHE